MSSPDVDVVIAGAGFAGLYQLHKLRSQGFSCQVIEKADDVGGTWYWNRYPGARCDIESLDYCYTFDPALEKEWQWSEKYATQPEILRYLQFVADRYDLRKDIRFSTAVTSAHWQEESRTWLLRLDNGEELTCRFYVMATGCLSQPKDMDIPGANTFTGETWYTSRWPHEPVDFTGKRVVVIGTGSSGIQSIPLIAQQASHLTVMQRTPNFSIPAHNGPIRAVKQQALETDRDKYRELSRWSQAGVHSEGGGGSALAATAEERQQAFEGVWQAGALLDLYTVYNDLVLDEAANNTIADFLRDKIRGIVKDPATAEALCPNSFPFGTKRPCLDTRYFETFNLPHVDLVDLRKTALKGIVANGVETADGIIECDAIVFATGFDAMTGAIAAVDIEGVDGMTLKEKWQGGPATYLGLMTAGFPNYFMITGPGSPSVLSNMAVSIEQHVDWIADCLAYMRANQLTRVEATTTAENGWVKHVREMGDLTLFPKANSWYMGANVPGKPRVFLPYVGGVDTYRSLCNDVCAKDYLGFAFAGANGERCNDGLVWPMQADVGMMLRFIESLAMPPLEEGSVADARAFAQATAAQSPPGPEVGAVSDGMMQGADGDIEYRLYRPATAGPHPVTVYYHGGGWVFGDHTTDDAFCRYLCKSANTLVISVNYRHAPEARFPAAALDGKAALDWVAANMDALGGNGRIAVAGWSAGGNVAAVACQLVRDKGGPAISGQLLVTPVTDADFSRASYVDNADGFVLTTPLMHWFWDHYIDPADRRDPLVAPLHADNLGNLPPAMVVTCEFDPLRDEGRAYAEALEAAGVPVQYLECPGQVHTSVTAVGAIASSEGARRQMAQALAGFFAG